MAELSNKQKAFCQEYIKDFNITQAMLRAGYSLNYAQARGHEMLENVGIKEEISKYQAIAAEKSAITVEMVLAEYAKIAFFDARKLYKDDGSVNKITELDDQTAGAIIGVDVCTTVIADDISSTTAKIRLSDKRAALDSICKVLGFNAPEKREHSGAIAIEQITGVEVK